MARLEQRIAPARSGQNVAATTATTFSRPTAGVIPSADGTLVGTLADDSSTVSVVVLGGVLYPLSLASVDATNGVALVALFNTTD